MKAQICSISLLVMIVVLVSVLCSCDYKPSATDQNVRDTQTATENILSNQKTPTDINFSLERYNLIKRAYWVNGEREKAEQVPCNVQKPIGYITLIVGNTILAQYTVDGKLSSLNSYLSADSQYYECTNIYNNWLADVDGSYGTNVDGVFWFDCNGNYHEWNGQYHYSDIPLTIDDPTVHILTGGEE